jgi:hypothetical protein
VGFAFVFTGTFIELYQEAVKIGVWNGLVVPLATSTYEAANWIWTSIVVPAGKAVAYAGAWIWTSVLVPLGKWLYSVLSWAWAALVDFVAWVFQSLKKDAVHS